MVLTDQAVANILQIALIINIGAALANSGVNDIFLDPGGSSNPGAIGTGDATAIGNDTDQYVTQAARTEATQEMDDFANQLAIACGWGSPRPTAASTRSPGPASRAPADPSAPATPRPSATTR